jgi:hypothetical protein
LDGGCGPTGSNEGFGGSDWGWEIPIITGNMQKKRLNPWEKPIIWIN